MATTKLAAPTVAAIGVTIGTLMAPLLAPLVAAAERIAAGITDLLAGQTAQARQLAEIAAQLAAAPASDTPPVTTPDPGPPVTTPDPEPAAGASGCVVTLTSTSGTTWRWDATAAARQDGLGLRAVTDVPAEIAGCTSLRLVVDLGPGWAVVAPRNDIAMREGGGEARFSLAVALDGAAVLEKRDMVIGMGAGDMFLVGREPSWPLPTTAELISKGLVARYAPGPVAESKLAPWLAQMASADWNARGSSRGITTDMYGTGGRDDIGPTTGAQAAYLVTRDPRLLTYLVGQAEAATRIPWGLWDAERSSWLSAEDYPLLWTQEWRSTDATPGDRNARRLTVPLSKEGWSVDSAHQPDLSYLAYLLTGRRAFLDNLQAQAAWNILNAWSAERGAAGLVAVHGGQVRGVAWVLRQLDEALYCSPAGSPERAYFQRASDACWDYLLEQIPLWTAQQGEAAGWVPAGSPEGGGERLWQQDYLASSVLAATRRGNAKARQVLKWIAPFHLARVPRLGHDACAYLVCLTDPQDDRKSIGTWAGIKAATEAAGLSNGAGWERTNGDYALLLRFTLLGIADVMGNAEAARQADWLVAEGAPFTTPADYVREPMLRVEVTS